jgi:hypothetical protein
MLLISTGSRFAVAFADDDVPIHHDADCARRARRCIVE